MRFKNDFTRIESGDCQSFGSINRVHEYGRELIYNLARGPGALERVNVISVLLALASSCLSRVRKNQECKLQLLPGDIIRLTKEYLS
jgi:hypothetical protein